jgi:hypothetical protein
VGAQYFGPKLSASRSLEFFVQRALELSISGGRCKRIANACANEPRRKLYIKSVQGYGL